MAAIMEITHLAWLLLYLAVGRITDPLGVHVVFAVGGGLVVGGTVLSVLTPGFRALEAHDAHRLQGARRLPP